MTRFTAPHFSDESYREILNVITSSGYRPLRVDETERFAPIAIFTQHEGDNVNGAPSDKFFILRHDVDISLDGAFKLGRLDKEMGVVSNFFFQLNAATYQALSSKCVSICRELQQMGHLVGLHVDSALFREDEENILATINWIRDSLFPMDYAVSFHRPGKDTLGKSYSAFASAYAEGLFNPDCYASDSRGEDFFYEKLDAMLDKELPYFQLLLHPCWWEEETDRARIRARHKNRYADFIDDYLIENFPKVFKEIIERDRDERKEKSDKQENSIGEEKCSA